MIAIYCVSLFLFIYYFGIGYKRFQSESYSMSKIALVSLAVIFRLFGLKLGLLLPVTFINVVIDLVNGYLIYTIAKKYYDEKTSVICASFYLFNPVIMIYSCAWRSSITTWLLLLLLAISFIENKKLLLAGLCFGISLYFYVGTVFLVPVFLLVLAHGQKEKKWKKMDFLSAIAGLGISFGSCIVLQILRGSKAYFLDGINNMLFRGRMAYNACNLWTMVGWNWKQVHLSSEVCLILFIGLMLLLTVGMFYLDSKWKKSKKRYLFMALLMYAYGYCFGMGINEYFALPIVLLSLLCFVVSGNKKVYWGFVAFSIVCFFNQIYTLSLYDASAFDPMAPSLVIFSFLTLSTLVVMTRWLLSDNILLVEGVQKQKEVRSVKKKEVMKLKLLGEKLETKDYITMGVFVIIFTALSLPRLGSHVAPNTTFKLSDETTKEIILDLGETKQIDHLEIFLGQEHGINVFLSSYNTETGEWDKIGDKQLVQSVFAWNEVNVNMAVQYLGIVIEKKEAFFNELVIIGENGEVLTPIETEKYQALFDEQNLYKPYPNYYDQTFFDEVYHARTAYEFIIGDTAYENTHPPLGKFFISLGIRVFGMNPFGWRIAVEIFGIIMIPLMYLFARRLFKEYWAAAMTTLLLTMDFMHFTLAKIATLDIIIGFFILLMYYFMYQYCQIDIAKEPLKKGFIPLGACGITMGIGIATKWTGVYAGAGLAVIFFTHIWKAYIGYKGDKKPILNKILKTGAFCIVFFVVIPMIIYCLSYIPFVGYRPYNGLLDKVFDNMNTMYNYHSKLISTHPYESWWYEWPWMKRPLFQAAAYRPDGTGSVISCFGNPLVWWPGIVSLLYCFKLWLWDKDKKAGFLCISYLAQLIPWMFVTRNTFIYHYFACSLFNILMTGYSLYQIMSHYKKGRKLVCLYGILVILVFAMFYPVISGIWVDKEMAKLWLKWLSGWTII